MGLFGKSFEEKVNDALEKVRGQFPGSNVTAAVKDKTVTLQGSAPDLATKGSIMTAFNALVETDNTFNQITIPQAAAPRAGAPAMPPPMMSSSGPAGSAGPRIHEVTKGETLSAISKQYYGNAGKYMKIFDANKDILDNPDLIKVGQKLKIPE